jgi:hypothetical protein
LLKIKHLKFQKFLHFGWPALPNLL